jgi:hypothetical protein
MNPGEVVLAHNINRILGQDDNGKPTMSGQFVAPKGEDYVFVFLGYAPRKGASPDGKPFNVDGAMERLGWQRKR